MTDDNGKSKRDILKENLEKKISGEIVLSDEPGQTIKKWRNIFKISQRDLADEISVMPSVISDYELGRRKSPGIKMIHKIVDGLLRVDELRGGEVIREFSDFTPSSAAADSIFDIREFTTGVSIGDFAEKLGIDLVVHGEMKDNEIYGYSLIDSLKAIVELSPNELVKLYGMTTERALVFSRVQTGRSPMIAIKVTNLKPGFVVFHGDIKRVDELAKRIAKAEGVPVGICRCNSTEELQAQLREKFK
ncbi:MAG: helix-turn-helix domain-containing protein [Candidatus Aenigmatarchaeota archaeon]